MIEIVPAILPKNFVDLREKLSLVRGLARLVQIDICDDKLNFENGLPFWEDFDFEIDLMIEEPESKLDYFINAGARRIIFHLEITKSLDPSIKKLSGIADIGIALDWVTPVNAVEPFLEKIDTVQVMGIKRIGFQGEPFEESVVDKVAILHDKYPNLAISVDGGVNLKNAPRLIQAGAARLIVGSAIFESDNLQTMIEKFKALQ
ncbi:MAG: hypothetical protein A3D52_01050 [Candidatus Taylorbacteria bacterium RIFCSPHIGHO2_02_FULL_44_36]|uniref:Ribulose-phosphate 3-epimerase n=1 Tax=Candidatus Taylorbacteria bacterium RIFCSPLOWO2_12_FULL_44_15c TaxID=1802333 RepID=A0A1G2P5Z2_9BACT|nr:MAG: hypothetical protein A3D52_01050 [Candidatus Taylorbacteria bacterium RIFCSPHIGHO2_02_FULL_44_36]OHA37918.1 MAG: hypothetical protein A3I97_00585 [Candidatus Taylorbacteria bacterium RIFCSPLOWO2_02_FULL_44_35]OHA43758.1 MAG: hypothetical protein A3G03_02010 [Candidatus Taylorbacteria bacterium RIFCSPLOWO2_12_FULL_44_15c]